MVLTHRREKSLPELEARGAARDRSAFVVLALFGILLRPAVGGAQDQPDPADAAKRQLGPISFTPTLSTTFGVDTNVFNEAEGTDRDLVGSVRPHVDAWLRLGRGRVSASSTMDFVYFRQYESERSVNTENTVRVELMSTRVRPYASLSFINTRQRLNFEIDTRARYVQRALTAGVDVSVGARTRVGIAAARGNFAFGEGVTDLRGDLRELLNRDTEVLTLSVRQRLTPLTTFVATARREQEHFMFSPSRDSESFAVTPGVEFSTFALLNGSAFVGYRRFTPDDPAIPEYTGLVASVDLGYTLLGSTRFTMRATRDVAYSVEQLEPYYVRTGIEGSVARRFTNAWEVLGSVGQQRLGYRRVQVAPPGPTAPVRNATALPLDGRTDTVLTFLAGVGYRLGEDARVGLNLDYSRRGSLLDDRTFRGMRVNSVMIYGF